MLDRGLLDAFIAQETFAFIDRAAGRGAFFTQFGCLGVMMAGSIVWAAFFNDAGVNWTRYGSVIGAILIIFLVFWAWPKKGPYALYREMRDTYQLLTGSVVSVPELRRRVERAREKGVVWPAELYAVLDGEDKGAVRFEASAANAVRHGRWTVAKRTIGWRRVVFANCRGGSNADAAVRRRRGLVILPPV